MQANHRPADFSVSRMDWRHFSRRNVLLCLFVLTTLLLLAQAIELSHSHENLKNRLDCQLCLKHSSKGKVLISTAYSPVPSVRAFFVPERDFEQAVLSLPQAKSRAPPQLSFC